MTANIDIGALVALPQFKVEAVVEACSERTGLRVLIVGPNGALMTAHVSVVSALISRSEHCSCCR